MKVEQWLKKAEITLNQAEINTARLEPIILLEDQLGKDRSYLLAHGEHKINAIQLNTLNRQIKTREKHIPLAYIRGSTEFYDRKFSINKNVLVPRPETEVMIELATALQLPKNPVIADIGTGSGVLAVTAKLEIPDSTVVATEINSLCLKIAILNAKDLKAKIRFYEGNLFMPLLDNRTKVDMVLANLPYVPQYFKLNKAAQFEPKIAIFGGMDGLDLYRQLLNQIHELKKTPQYILTEALPPQHIKMEELFKKFGFEIIKSKGLIQVFKSD